MFSFLQKINPKKRDPSSASSTASPNRHADLIIPSSGGSDTPGSHHMTNSMNSDLLPSIDFSPDLQQITTGTSKKSVASSKKSSQSTNSFTTELTTKEADVVLSKDSSGHSKLINPFGKNNPFSRKSHMSLSSIGSGYFTTGRFHEKKHKAAASLGTLNEITRKIFVLFLGSTHLSSY